MNRGNDQTQPPDNLHVSGTAIRPKALRPRETGVIERPGMKPVVFKYVKRPDEVYPVVTEKDLRRTARPEREGLQEEQLPSDTHAARLAERSLDRTPRKRDCLVRRLLLSTSAPAARVEEPREESMYNWETKVSPPTTEPPVTKKRLSVRFRDVEQSKTRPSDASSPPVPQQLAESPVPKRTDHVAFIPAYLRYRSDGPEVQGHWAELARESTDPKAFLSGERRDAILQALRKERDKTDRLYNRIQVGDSRSRTAMRSKLEAALSDLQSDINMFESSTQIYIPSLFSTTHVAHTLLKSRPDSD